MRLPTAPAPAPAPRLRAFGERDEEDEDESGPLPGETSCEYGVCGEGPPPEEPLAVDQPPGDDTDAALDGDATTPASLIGCRPLLAFPFAFVGCHAAAAEDEDEEASVMSSSGA